MNKDKLILKEFFIMEYRAIFRNKFLRINHILGLFFIPYTLFMLTNINDKSFSVFLASLLAAFPVIGLSMHIFSKDGYFYESIITRNIPFKLYVKGKVLFIIGYSMMFCICLIPLIVFYTNVLILNSFMAGIVYYCGFGIFIMLYISSYDKHKIDPNIIPFFSYQGFSIIKTIFLFPIICFLFFWEETIQWGISIMILLGIIGALMHNKFIDIISENLSKRKYKYLMTPLESSN